MRIIALSVLGAALSACATTEKPPLTVGETVQARDESTGTCALYGWTVDQMRGFVFYADESTARYDTEDGPVDLIAEATFPSSFYTDPAGGRVEVRFGEGEAMAGGMRFPTARIVTKTADGWERLRPVALVQNCKVK